MNNLDYDKVLNRANEYYVQAKIDKGHYVFSPYHAPEQIPQIQSDQVTSLLKAIIDELKFANPDG